MQIIKFFLYLFFALLLFVSCGKLSETDKSSQYETEIFLTLKGNAEKNIKVLYEINKVSDGGFVTDSPKTLKVWVDEKKR